MSLLFNLIAKLSVEEEVEEDHKARFFSSSPHKQRPYMILEGDKVGESSEAENIVMNFKLFDLSKEEIIEVTHKTFPKFLYEGSRVIGSSRGWTAFMTKHDGTVHLSDVFSLMSPRVITLPSLSDPLRLRSSAIMNVSISSPPDQDEDYLVFVKFFDSGLYYCRPNRGSQWTIIYIGLYQANFCDVIYSPRNQMLCLVIPGAKYLLCYDLNMEKKYRKLHLRNVPKMPQSECEVLALCCKTEHLVESSCGQCFIVRRYVETYDKGDNDVIFNKTKRFMVFTLDKRATLLLVGGILHLRFVSDWDSIIALVADPQLPFVESFLIRYAFQASISNLWNERNGRRHGKPRSSIQRLLMVIDKTIRNRISTLRTKDSRFESALVTWFASR